MASASGYNYHRFARAVLKKSRKWEPSLSIQLYANYWRFENSEINFLYDGPMKPFLLALRAQVIPPALFPFLFDIRPPVMFVDGCLVVELQDFRKGAEIRSRVVMRPAPETLPLTIGIMLERKKETWEDTMMLELESRILAATSAPLYLGTSILATRNAALSLALTAPAGRNMAADGSFRAITANGEDEDSELESVRKLLTAGSRGAGGAFQPNWSVLRVMERLKAYNKQKEQEAAARAAGRPIPGDPSAVQPPASSATGTAGDEEKKKVKKKRPAEESEDKKVIKKKKPDDKDDKKKSGKKEPEKKKKKEVKKKD